MAAIPTVALTQEVHIPAIGYGVGTKWFKAPGTNKEEPLIRSIVAALDAGFRHLDDAEMYGNQLLTGKAVAQWLERTGSKREDLFITDKVMSVDACVEKTCRKSLASSGLKYFDLYLVHAPQTVNGKPFVKSLKDIWAEMESLVDAGLVKVIGVSNFAVPHLEEIYESARIKPVLNQIESHPYLQQPKLFQWCQDHNIVVSAYCGLASLSQASLQGGPVDAAVAKVAARAKKTPDQVLLKYGIQRRQVMITTTSTPSRMADYLSIFDLDLTAEEVSEITAAGASATQQRMYWKTMPIDA